MLLGDCMVLSSKASAMASYSIHRSTLATLARPSARAAAAAVGGHPHTRSLTCWSALLAPAGWTPTLTPWRFESSTTRTICGSTGVLGEGAREKVRADDVLVVNCHRVSEVYWDVVPVRGRDHCRTIAPFSDLD